MNTLTDGQVNILSSIMVHRFTDENREALNSELSELIHKHNLVGLERKRFEIEFLYLKIKQASSMN